MPSNNKRKGEKENSPFSFLLFDLSGMQRESDCPGLDPTALWFADVDELIRLHPFNHLTRP
jgi:hypothetical protein